MDSGDFKIIFIERTYIEYLISNRIFLDCKLMSKDVSN